MLNVAASKRLLASTVIILVIGIHTATVAGARPHLKKAKPSYPHQSLTIISERNGAPLVKLANGSVVDISTFQNQRINIRYEPGMAQVRRVVFDYDNRHRIRVEQNAPFKMLGDTATAGPPWRPKVGKHRIRVTVYSGARRHRWKVTSYTVNFRVIATTSRPAQVAGDKGVDTVGLRSKNLVLPTYRINVGGPSFVDTKGNFWQGDEQLSAAAPFGLTTLIDGSTTQPVLQSGRSSEKSPITYAMPTPSGDYRITLHFMAPYGSRVGQWVFDVEAEGIPRIKSLDPVASTTTSTPVVMTIKVHVEDGELNLQFLGRGGGALLNGFEIRPDLPTAEREVPAIDFQQSLNQNSGNLVETDPDHTAISDTQSSVDYLHPSQ